MKKVFQFIILTAFTILVGCDDNEAVKPEPKLVQSNLLFTRDASELRTFINASGLKLPVTSLTADVEVYKITYKTSYKGLEVVASGLVILPETTTPVPMVSFHHGTIVAHNQAPSAIPLSSTELILYSALASPGFITVVPDYLGFGSSTSIFHPYYVEELSASAVTDMLIAAKELAQQKSTPFNGKLFLAGYSQGGYVTMAAHKSIEQNGLDGFSLIASFPAAGGYDVKGMQEEFFKQQTYGEPFYMAFVASAYKSVYDWTQPLSLFFKEPYASQIPSLFDGSKNGSQINASLTTTVADLVQPSLLTGIDTNPQYSFLVDAFVNNSLLDWTPKVQMHMYHGTADVTVFYSNSIKTYEKFILNGASPNTVTFTPLNGATHFTGAFPYIESFVPKMISLK